MIEFYNENQKFSDRNQFTTPSNSQTRKNQYNNARISNKDKKQIEGKGLIFRFLHFPQHTYVIFT